MDTMEGSYICLDCGQVLRREDIARVFGGYACAKCGGKIMLYNTA
ncbi:MAG: DNA-directed RNA polymerase subunit RPC12/RpoP [Candidatus Nitrosomirales archaeon]|jgi:DNA-directed RNA polymerase subunit RPC12/RpoP